MASSLLPNDPVELINSAAHRPLWRRIADQGLLLSEYRPGPALWRWTLTARRRTMAALVGTAVVVRQPSAPTRS